MYLPKSLLKWRYRANSKQDPNDERDYKFTNLGDHPISMPMAVDHSPKMSSVKDQKSLGSCVAFSVAALKEWQEQIEHEKEVIEGKRYRRNKPYNLSEQWLYWNCKKIDPWPGEEGTNPRSAMKVLSTIGVPTENAWPYRDSNRNIGKPEKWAHLIARWATIGSYWRVEGLKEIKQALIDSPIIIGMACFEEMFRHLPGGIIPCPLNSDDIWGYHAVCAVGFSDKTQLLKFKNSWGGSFGQGGYAYLPYAYVNDYVEDCWAVRDIVVTRDMLKGTRLLID